jgi:rRNA maturation protein Nop10
MYKCDNHGYCLTETCPKCKLRAKKAGTIFSLEDKYGEYRRKCRMTGP